MARLYCRVTMSTGHHNLSRIIHELILFQQAGLFNKLSRAISGCLCSIV